MTATWNQRFVVRQLFPSKPFVDRKFQNAYSFGPLSHKVDLVIGQYISLLDRCSDMEISENVSELTLSLMGAGYSLSVFQAAAGRIVTKNPHLDALFYSNVLPMVSQRP